MHRFLAALELVPKKSGLGGRWKRHDLAPRLGEVYKWLHNDMSKKQQQKVIQRSPAWPPWPVPSLRARPGDSLRGPSLQLAQLCLSVLLASCHLNDHAGTGWRSWLKPSSCAKRVAALGRPPDTRHGRNWAPDAPVAGALHPLQRKSGPGPDPGHWAGPGGGGGAALVVAGTAPSPREPASAGCQETVPDTNNFLWEG